jgi:membrane-bound lytic murein transglycosylase D
MRAWLVSILIVALGSGSFARSVAHAELAPPPAPPEPEAEAGSGPKAAVEAEPQAADPEEAPLPEAPPEPDEYASADAVEPAPEPPPATDAEQAPPPPPEAGAQAEAPTVEAIEQEIERAVAADPNEADVAPPIEAESVPPALSTAALSDAPAAVPSDVAMVPELDWLAGAVLPDLSIRWDDRLVEQLLYYRDNPNGRAQVRSLIIRSGRYAAMIREKLGEHTLPSDLLYVAMVESGYDPLAKSPVGAVGMWQFVETTGREYGLAIDKWVDERQSPERATEAAAKFFKDLHARLGSWPLAIAAFNMGYGALLRSIKKYNSNDIGVLSRIEAGLPYETIAYVSKVTAFAIVARNPERFGLTDLKPEDSLQLTKVDVPGGLGLGKLARAAGITVEELAAYNPELLRSRIPPDVKRWTLRIPSERAARFAEKIETLPSEAPTHGHYVMRFGERLRDVAAMFGTTDAKLRALNDFADGAEALPGSKLLVPDVEPEALPVDTSEVVVGVPAQSFDVPERKRVFYAVRSGDTALNVATFFDVTLDELCRWNDVATDASLQPGMVLQLFVPKQVDLASAITIAPERVRTLVVGSEAFFAHHESLRDRVRVRYRVRTGDTLESLAERYELSAGSIARINSFSRYSKLELGSEIILYVPEAEAEKLGNVAEAGARQEPKL